ncbi:MAG: hypothetical protein ACPLRW_08310 [Moorellales bacterium]
MVVMRGLNVHLVPFLTDRGLDLITASRLAALTGVLGVPSLLLGDTRPIVSGRSI